MTGGVARAATRIADAGAPECGGVPMIGRHGGSA